MEETLSWITFNGFTAHEAALGATALVLLCVSALVSGAETSFFSLTHNDVQQLKKNPSPAAEAVLRLRMLNSMEPLGILLRKSDSHLFRQLGNDLRVGANLYDCWRERCAIETRRGGALDSLSSDDIIILDGFFKHLGGSGREEQGELFSGVIGEMEEAQSHARRSYADASKVYTALGTLVGIGLCVLIV